MKKVAGYIFVVVGLILAASNIGGVNALVLKVLPFLANVSKLNSMILGAVFVVIGIVLVFSRGGERQKREVPIYRGKNIVGYRRN